MREVVFALEYEPGCDRVADALADHPGARIRSRSLHATDESLWRVDHATGPPEALAAVEAAFLSDDYYADCLVAEACGATQTTRVLEQTSERLVLYSYWERTSTCASVPHIALDHLGDGVLFETRYQGRRYTWRVIHSGEGDVRAFFDDVEAAAGDCAGLEVIRLKDTSSPTGGPTDETDLPPEQAAALRAAVEHGYYETPREVDVGELADLVDVPRSTLAYRLRRAEAQLATREVSRQQSPEASSMPL